MQGQRRPAKSIKQKIDRSRREDRFRGVKE